MTGVVKWVQHTTRVNDVTDILEKYPCIMNEQTLRAASATKRAYSQTRDVGGGGPYIDPSSADGKTLAVWVTPQLEPFSR
ncbi:hypothetical protein GQ600_6257 [Phytophthora cactorum]|nr:hypothetical protein GQ600_6257 [Phytophthora cactorum]